MAVVKALMIFSMPFVLAEAGTGIVSFLTGELSIPPVAGVGMAVDLAIFVAGMLLAVFRGTRSLGIQESRQQPSSDEESQMGS